MMIYSSHSFIYPWLIDYTVNILSSLALLKHSSMLLKTMNPASKGAVIIYGWGGAVQIGMFWSTSINIDQPQRRLTLIKVDES